MLEGEIEDKEHATHIMRWVRMQTCGRYLQKERAV